MKKHPEIRPILAKDDQEICRIIKSVGQEYGAVGEGFGPSDPEVEAMSQHYGKDGVSMYLVVAMDQHIVGGCGIAPFQGSQEICELRKLFLLPECRGLGIGKLLTNECLALAHQHGFKQCYLDTLKSMTSAISLYEKIGFRHLSSPLDGTIHGGCDVWMLIELDND
ncbi:GNAT family N-acetyltransferase [Veronia pacifica]|uniref:Acetyltransferase n=1 Tax=Veronia pacifica TaxID=1080227 RepID=A0A1C3E7I8_9GAMM|nr:GNAT family N-acetyltransferase [Veronia pacifica]ODA29215.1 acetyltransferase [Veronia pacifica]